MLGFLEIELVEVVSCAVRFAGLCMENPGICRIRFSVRLIKQSGILGFMRYGAVCSGEGLLRGLECFDDVQRFLGLKTGVFDVSESVFEGYLSNLSCYLIASSVLADRDEKFDDVIGVGEGYVAGLVCAGSLHVDDGLEILGLRHGTYQGQLDVKERYGLVIEGDDAWLERIGEIPRIVGKESVQKGFAITGKRRENPEKPLENLLRCTQIRAPKKRFISGLSGRILDNPLDIRQELIYGCDVAERIRYDGVAIDLDRTVCR